jgi:hypothetical protein
LPEHILLEGVILEWMQLRKRDIDDLLQGGFDPGFFSLKDLIVGGQI